MERLRWPSVILAGPTELRRRAGRIRFRGVAIIVPLLATGCEAADRVELVVATDLPEALRDYAERTFEEKHPDIDVHFVPGATASGAATSDGGRSPSDADVWWGVPAMALQAAAASGRLLPHRPPWVAQPGVGEPDPEGRWQATLVSPFVVAFNRGELTLTRAPSDWIDLFHFRWFEEVAALDPARNREAAWFLGSLVVKGLRDDDDLDEGFDWMGRLDEQVESYWGGSDEIVRALESRTASLGILPRYAAEAARHDRAPWLYYRLPESGTPMLVLGVAIMAGTDAVDGARFFVDHIGGIDVATEAKLRTRWQPAHGDVDMTRFPDDFEIDQPWTPWMPATDTLAAELDGWVSRWDSEVRGR